jgi:hypothetical protein
MRKLLLGVLIVLILVPAAGYLLLRSYLPDYEAQLQVPGLQGKVSITRNHLVPASRLKTSMISISLGAM